MNVFTQSVHIISIICTFIMPTTQDYTIYTPSHTQVYTYLVTLLGNSCKYFAKQQVEL